MSAEDIEYMDDYKEFPTKESALDWLDNYLSLDERNNLIRALQQEPFINKQCVSSGVCEHDKNKVLDKLRAEIEKQKTTMNMFNREDTKQYAIAMEDVLKIIDKYKAKD